MFMPLRLMDSKVMMSFSRELIWDWVRPLVATSSSFNLRRENSEAVLSRRDFISSSPPCSFSFSIIASLRIEASCSFRSLDSVKESPRKRAGCRSF